MNDPLGHAIDNSIIRIADACDRLEQIIHAYERDRRICEVEQLYIESETIGA